MLDIPGNFCTSLYIDGAASKVGFQAFPLDVPDILIHLTDIHSYLLLQNCASFSVHDLFLCIM